MTSAVDGGPVRARAGWAWPAVAGLLLLATLAPEPAHAQTGICGRTEAVRDAILREIPGVSDCADVTATHLAAITDLNLGYKNISALAAGDFDGLTALGFLDLKSNDLSLLPAGVFSDLTALTYLDLYDNQLSLLPAGVFYGLTSLTSLYLGGNQLSSLPAGVFSDLTALEGLHLYNNQLSSLPAGVFSGLTALDLYDNQLSSLPAGVFSDLTALTYLDLYGNQLSWLPDGVFYGLTALERLSLGGNPVDPLPVAVSLEPAGPGRFRAVAPTAAPFALTLPVSVVNGEIDGGATTLTIPVGMVHSDPVSVTRSAGSASAVTADIRTLPGLPSGHDGYALQKSSGLPLEVFAEVPTLSALTVSVGGTDLLTFASGTTTYTAMVTNDVETVTFTATKNDDGASVAYLDSDGNTLDDADTTEDGFQVALSVGANAITVRVTAEDGMTAQDYTVTVTRAEALPAVTIAADHAAFTAVLDLVTFTLTRTEDPAAELDVSVALTQDKALLGSGHLAQTVTFGAGEATATLSIYDYFFAGNTVTGETALTATVQDGSGYVPGSPNTASTRIRVADPAVTASFEQTAYTFDEAAGDATVAVILRTAADVPVPHGDIFLSINSETIPGGASPGGVDFENPAGSIQVVPSDFTADGTTFTARKEVTLAIVDDALDEPDEALTVILEPLPSTQAVVALSQPDGTACPVVHRCDATVTIVDNDEAPNTAPSFTSSPTFDAAENQTAVGTVEAEDSDAGDAVTGYAITGGADQGFFSIGATSGALTFQTAPNFEDAQDQGAGNTYEVTVQATSGTGERVKRATQAITVTVRDDDSEAPATPDAPSVSPASVTSLSVSWPAPDNDGPAITDYDYRYRTTSPQGAWVEMTNTTITALSATITGLAENTEYDVQVRATNDEGTSGWSASGSGATDANAAPTFTSSTTFDAAENQTAVGTVEAEDSDAGDAVTGYAITGGADQGFFSIGATSGALTFQTAPNFEDAQDQGAGNTYEVTVQATSGTGERVKRATQAITVTVRDADEQPDKPAKPTLAAHPNLATSLVASWTKPGLNGGPDIIAYAVEYREGTTGTWIVAIERVILTELQLHGLAEGTEYQVRVQALNGETPSDWSDPSDAVRTGTAVIPELEVTLQLSNDLVLESEHPVTVTATVSPATPVAFTVTISATPVAPATSR